MDNIKTLEHGAKFAHVTVGELNVFEGKAFLKDATGATSCEISFGSLPTGASVPFFHSHKANEENYIVLSGKGLFQVDENVFEISSGSVVRVATDSNRNLKCTSEEPLVYICIQAKEGSLEGYTMTDGIVTECKNLMD
ncbi:MAG: cupin domain-containing protein [Muribaculaceae bacterium]|nr:cupin domain-containing protein [Muribaculaceae bacterium]